MAAPVSIMILSYYVMTDKEEKNAQRYARLVSLRERDPKRFLLVRIVCKWDELNAEYSRKGISDTFVFLRKQLKELIRRSAPVVSSQDITELSERFPDVVKNGKLSHGYNFRYMAVK